MYKVVSPQSADSGIEMKSGEVLDPHDNHTLCFPTPRFGLHLCDLVFVRWGNVGYGNFAWSGER